MKKKQATMDIIAENTANLLREREGELPTTREVVKETGFSIGTIYAHFGSIRGIVRHLVFLRQSAAVTRIAQIIALHDPKADASHLCDKIVDECFNSFKSNNPKVVRKLFKMALDASDRASDLDRVSDRLVPFILDAIARDETKTFNRMSDNEIVVLLRGMIGIIRSPLLENNPYFGTPEHIIAAKAHLRKIFVQNV